MLTLLLLLELDWPRTTLFGLITQEEAEGAILEEDDYSRSEANEQTSEKETNAALCVLLHALFPFDVQTLFSFLGALLNDRTTTVAFTLRNPLSLSLSLSSPSLATLSGYSLCHRDHAIQIHVFDARHRS